ncbi:MAG TPA: hypothetical protein VJT49_14135 [Amycolatopsis sp.]|uniref:hypothetical protein n=1 Tax=Amycolatopsis sp. TaxID=37632 RepID=UPI002B466EED|nr:hypothetical protein [Amycolatopsis sp.]HKS46220.1 hypothetical protein [Amycolatopsis sp.]
MFAHAAVRIDDKTAGPLLADLRQQAGATQSPEAKFAQFKTRRGRKALADALGPGGALEDRVVIDDKRYLIVSKMIDLLVEELTHTRGIDLYRDGTARKLAVSLFRDGPRGLGELWDPLMAAFVSLARTTHRGGGDKETVDSFFARLDQARWRCRRRSVEPLLGLLLQTRAHADDLVLLDKLRTEQLLLVVQEPHRAVVGGPGRIGRPRCDRSPAQEPHRDRRRPATCGHAVDP